VGQEKTFIVFRKAPGEDQPKYQRYTIPITPSMTILEALFYIQDHLDTTLAFRYACRGAICGSCGMTINKLPQLACNIQVLSLDKKIPQQVPDLVFGDVPNWDKENEILIEPLPNMEIIKDLVVDMAPFWQFYREVKPFFDKEWKDVAPETQQSPKEIKEIERLIYCILCAACVGACPVNAKNKEYLGPAALAKSYRFLADSRSTKEHREEIEKRIVLQDGVPACEKVFACNAVCPKGVKPGTAIALIRKRMEERDRTF